MADCIFCRIAAGELATPLIHQGEDFVAFRDVAPQAPTHLLVVPRQHISSLADLSDPALSGRLLQAVRETAHREGLEDDGYRVLTNIGQHGGQTVPHLHFHILGGRHLGWPPG